MWYLQPSIIYCLPRFRWRPTSIKWVQLQILSLTNKISVLYCICKRSIQKRIKSLILAGLEPAIPWFVVRCLIRWATGPRVATIIILSTLMLDSCNFYILPKTVSLLGSCLNSTPWSSLSQDICKKSQRILQFKKSKVIGQKNFPITLMLLHLIFETLFTSGTGIK